MDEDTRAALVAAIAAQLPSEVYTDWEDGFIHGLRKAMRIVQGYG